ncbi:MAG: hypothetical protein RJB39_452 [Candidatus Parcubacteria bacterium]|jgi:thymidylate synthase
MKHDIPYLNLMRRIQTEGNTRGDRTGTGTISLFGPQNEYDLRTGFFPLLTTKEVNLDSIIGELLWFLSGDTNATTLILQGINIWNDWPCKYWLQQTDQTLPAQTDKAGWRQAKAEFVRLVKADPGGFGGKWGKLGPVYGKQWTKWETNRGTSINQIADLIARLKTEKGRMCRRLIVTAWNPADIEEMAVSGLPPCHCLFQFYVEGDTLHCKLYQRSADYVLGVPYNVACYSLLLMIVAKLTGLKPGRFIHTFGDAHLYSNHLDGPVATQLAREPRESPRLILTDENLPSYTSFKREHFTLEGYSPDPAIRAEIAV